MSEYKVSKQDLSEKNKNNRSSMTGTELAAYSALEKQEAGSKVSIDSDNNKQTKAASLGWWHGGYGIHFLTKSVDFDVNGTQFKGKRGYQVRGGAIPITTGLVADYNPAVLRAEKKEDKVKFENENTAPEIVFVNQKNDNKIVYIPVKVDKEASILEPGRVVLKSTEPYTISVNNNSVLEFDGFELTGNELKFNNPSYKVADEENGGELVPQGTDSAVIGPDGLKIESDYTEDNLEDTDLNAGGTKTTEPEEDARNTTDEPETVVTSEVNNIEQDNAAPKNTGTPAELEKAPENESSDVDNASNEEKGEDEEEDDDDDQSPLEAFLDEIKKTGIAIKDEAKTELEKLFKDGLSADDIKDFLNDTKQKGIEGGTDAFVAAFNAFISEHIENETIQGHFEALSETLGDVAKHFANKAADVDESEDEDDDKEEWTEGDDDEEFPLSDYIIAFFDGDENDPDDIPAQRIKYAKELLSQIKKNGSFAIDDPDDATLDALHLQNSKGDEKAKAKVNNYDFEQDYYILPWLYAFGILTPSWSLEIEPSYHFTPAIELDPEQLSRKIVANATGFGHMGKKKNQAGQEIQVRMIYKNEMQDAIEAIIASVEIAAGVSVALKGHIGVELSLGLGAGNPFLFGIEGLIKGGLTLGGTLDDKHKAAELGLEARTSLNRIIDGKNLKDKLGLDNLSANLDVGLGITSEVSAGARIRSRLFNIDYDLAEFFSVDYTLAKLNFNANCKVIEDGKFLGFNPETSLSAEVLGNELQRKKDANGKGAYGFEFKNNKANEDKEAVMEVLNAADSQSAGVAKLFEDISKMEGTDASNINAEELDSLIGKLHVASFDVERLMKKSVVYADLINNSKEFNEELDKATKEVEYHESILKSMNAWNDLNINEGRDKGSDGKSAYEYYMSIDGGNKLLDKSIRDGLRDEVLPSVTTRENLLAYEEERLNSYQAEANEMLATLNRLVALYKIDDMDVPNKDFTNAYMDASMGIISNGINDSLSLYADPEDIRQYERAQIAEETKKHTDRISSLEDYIEKNKIASLTEPNPQFANYYVKNLKATNLKDNLYIYAVDIDNVINYEASKFEDEKVKEYYETYISLKDKKAEYDAMEEGEPKESKKKEIADALTAKYPLSEILKNAYAMSDANDLINYEEKRIIEKRMDDLKKQRKDDGTYKMSHLIKTEGTDGNKAFEEVTTLQELIAFESGTNTRTFINKPDKLVIISYRIEQLQNAIDKAMKANDKSGEASQQIINKAKEDYFSGEFDKQASVKNKQDPSKVKENDDFLNFFIKSKSEDRDVSLNQRFTDKMLDNYARAKYAKHFERIEMVRKGQEEGKSQADILKEYEATEATQFKDSIVKKYSQVDTNILSVDQMVRYARFQVHEKTKRGFLQNMIKTLKESIKGTDSELVEKYKNEGHFERWEQLVELRDSDSFKELSPEQQSVALHKLYVDELLGGGGLQEELAKKYETIMTPNMILDYEKQRVKDLSDRRNKRLDTLEGKKKGDDLSEYKMLAESDGTGITATFKWLWKKISGNYTIDFDDQADAEKILTPANIIDYETKKKEQDGKKHQARVNMLKSSEGKSDAEIYQAYVNMGGGSGFLSAKSKDIKDYMDMRMISEDYNEGNYSLKTITGFETKQIEKAKERQQSGATIKDKINAQYERLSKLNDEINEKIAKIEKLRQQLTAAKGTT